jgi:hypothetical protein
VGYERQDYAMAIAVTRDDSITKMANFYKIFAASVLHFS